MARERVEYHGKQLYIYEIARQEKLVGSTLIKCYRETGNIYTAVELCKQISKPKGYIKKIEYNGEMLTLHAIAENEEISNESLKRYYNELGDIYEAVKTCKQNARGERQIIPYKNQKLALGTIARIEGISAYSLTKHYLKIGDIYKAVEACKQNVREKLEYNGEMLSLNAIADREGISIEKLSRMYSIIGDIYEAVKTSKTTNNMRKERIQRVEYNGEIMTLEQIAQKEGIDYDSLRKHYRKTQNIYEAVEICLVEKSKKVKKIEYKNGEMLAISVIAKKENIDIRALTVCYKKVGDIFEAVRICKEKSENRKIKREQRKQEEENKKISYKGARLELNEIARNNGVDAKLLHKILQVIPDVDKAVFMLKYQKRKGETVELQDMKIDLYDMSLLIGVKYSDLINLLNAGMTISEIKENYSNSEIAGENVILRSGRTLLQFCADEKVKFSFIYRATKTYGKVIHKASAQYRNNLKMPLNWIHEKYDKIFNALGITGLQTMIVIKDLQDGQMDLEETLEKLVITKNASKMQIPIEWSEALYGLVQTRKILGEDFQSEIQLNEQEKVFINECEAELLELKGKIPKNLDSTQKKRRGALIEPEPLFY